jgi:hypothetical protein
MLNFSLIIAKIIFSGEEKNFSLANETAGITEKHRGPVYEKKDNKH